MLCWLIIDSKVCGSKWSSPKLNCYSVKICVATGENDKNSRPRFCPCTACLQSRTGKNLTTKSGVEQWHTDYTVLYPKVCNSSCCGCYLQELLLILIFSTVQTTATAYSGRSRRQSARSYSRARAWRHSNSWRDSWRNHAIRGTQCFRAVILNLRICIPLDSNDMTLGLTELLFFRAMMVPVLPLLKT